MKLVPTVAVLLWVITSTRTAQMFPHLPTTRMFPTTTQPKHLHTVVLPYRHTLDLTSDPARHGAETGSYGGSQHAHSAMHWKPMRTRLTPRTTSFLPSLRDPPRSCEHD